MNRIDCEKCLHSDFDDQDRLRCRLKKCQPEYSDMKETREAYIEVVKNNCHVGHGDIDLDRMMVIDASNRSIYNRPIKKWVSTEVGCVKERPHIL